MSDTFVAYVSFGKPRSKSWSRFIGGGELWQDCIKADMWCLTRELMQEKARFSLEALQITVTDEAWLYREISAS